MTLLLFGGNCFSIFKHGVLERISTKVFDGLSTSDIQFTRETLLSFYEFQVVLEGTTLKQLRVLSKFVQKNPHKLGEVPMKVCAWVHLCKIRHSQCKSLYTFHFHIRARSVALELGKGPNSKHSGSHSKTGPSMGMKNVRLG